MSKLPQEHIKREDLKEGVLYEIRGRNMSIGYWDGDTGFTGLRWKFNDARIDRETLVIAGRTYETYEFPGTVSHVIRELCALPEGWPEWRDLVRLGWLVAWDDIVTNKE